MLRSYTIPYDDRQVVLKIPEENVRFYRNPGSVHAEGTNRKVLDSALAKSGKPGLDEGIRNKQVAMIIEDATRTVPLDDLLEVLGPHLAVAGSLIVLLATGTHDGENAENYAITKKVKQCAQKYRIPLTKVIIHDSHHDPFDDAGTTPGIGNQIYVNSAIREAEVFIVLSDMKNHYFAGYSNALKNFMPGICAYQTVERNHALTLRKESTFGHHPLHPDPERRDNPLAQDMWAAYRLIVQNRPAFVIATISMQNHIIWAGAGLLEEIVPEGIKQVDRLMSVKVDLADRLIISCGGYPNDESLYSAQRALELSKNGIRPGGEILFLAGCRNGIGPQKSVQNFYLPLKMPLAEILKQYDQKYVMYAHKTYKFAQLISQMKCIHVKSLLADNEISDIHLSPCTDAQQLIDRWLREDPAVTITIITEGNKYAVYANGG
jgi:nickel-dependent lactate racemase